ncbi:heavy metal translocating P-type ATPase [Pseudooctadecabacter jejudonensis]|uniref:Putative copper-importing P-type ATPase A n=1 Tax=Pseudooctadecabacter jejudonensis TaxID=1391910 RepID=A0A1Y5SUK8_9RHOB|nr:heavy metal translocating P-type ATPase [Pseudooctadecabacter jejudonensis]SLN48691.1 putative copper-importing P-type ATPase A [Pseudooctadecabacter jejudonensis]
MTAACPACVAAPAAIELAQMPDAVQLSVPALRCAACISAIESHLNALPDVMTARVNLSLKRVEVRTDLPTSDITQALASIGYDAYPLDAAALGEDGDQAGRDLLMRMGLSGFAMMNVMLLSVAVWSGAVGATRDLFHLISAAIAIPCVAYAAQPFFRNAARALKVGRLNMDVPISLAIVLAAAMSLYETLHGGAHAYFDAALSLTFFLLIGRYLEHRTRSAARSAAKELTALEVHQATRQTAHGSEVVPISALSIGDAIVVPTGMRVPVDGTLTSAHADTDRAFLTGESDPIPHTRGATLHAGEVNLGAPLHLTATAVGTDTRLHQIARLVDTAENARNRYTSLADRAAQIYAPAVHVLALVTFLGWVLVDGDIRHAVNVAIAVLIITCPCALGLAVPAVSTAAISKLYKLGFLVKSGTALERLAEVQTVLLDKTGTLTTPNFTFDLGSLSPSQCSIAKALADHSAHPLARALGRHLQESVPAPLTQIEEHKGKGVRAVWTDTDVALGQASWLGGRDGEARQGLTLKIGPVTIPLTYSEATRDGVPAMIAGLQSAGLTLDIMSGDTDAKTRSLADRLGIDRFAGHMSPEDKNARVGALADAGATPCMIGDGINDTIALTRAHASIAPGSALDAARNAADVVVVSDSMAQVPALFATARQTVRLSRQNFAIALAYNAVAVPIAIAGFATPLMAALAMSLSSITVLLNAMRIGVKP